MRVRPSAAMSLGITLGVLAVAAAPACNRANPLYRGLDGGAVTGAGGALGGAGDQGTAGASGGSGTAGASSDAGMPLDADASRDATLGAPLRRVGMPRRPMRRHLPRLRRQRQRRLRRGDGVRRPGL